MEVNFTNLNEFLDCHNKCPICNSRVSINIDYPIAFSCDLKRKGLQFYNYLNDLLFINIFNNDVDGDSLFVDKIQITQFCKKFHFSYTAQFKIKNNKVKDIQLLATNFNYLDKNKEKIGITSNYLETNKTTIFLQDKNMIQIPLTDFNFSKKLANKKIKKLKLLL